MNAAARVDPLLLGAHRRIFLRLLPPRKRSYREFAEQEIIVPNGPLEGLRFSCEYRPWVGEVLDEFGRGRYWRFFASGPTQDGKTFVFFVIPAAYHLFELEEDILLCGPTTEHAYGAYRQRLLPIIKASRFAGLLPTSGAGSKGGKAPEIVFGNGRSIRFVGAGGGDAQRSGWTAKAVFMTELDKMDDAGEASEESDPVTQMQARASAFMESGTARIFGECTMSVEDGFVYREVCLIGTDTRVFMPCPKCGEYVFPERKDFTGWSGAAGVEEAGKKAAYVCPKCHWPWTEAERRKSRDLARLVSRGQTIGKDGLVVGPPPETDTYGVRWNAMASLFKKMRDIGIAEWRAEFTDKEADKKAVVQFWWAEPWRPETLALTELNHQIVSKQTSGFLRGAVPPGAAAVTVAVDLGIHTIWWVAAAWMPDGRGHVIDYGPRDVPNTGAAEDVRILAALRLLNDEILKAGWSTPAGARAADLVVIDSGYHPDAAYTFVLESGQGAFAATKGFGSAYRAGGWIGPAKNPAPGMSGDNWTVTPQPSGIMLVNLHADYWKGIIHDGFAAAAGSSGSITLFRGEPREHLPFARQITGEKRIPEDDPKKPLRFRWHRTRPNHFLDCMGMARAAADMLGVKPLDPSRAKPSEQPSQGSDKPSTNSGHGWLRWG